MTPGWQGWTIDPGVSVAPRVFHDGAELALSPIRARLLAMVVLNEGVCTIAALGTIGVKSRKSLHAHMCYIRRSLPFGWRLANNYALSYKLERI